MAGLRYYSRRARRLLSSKVFQITCIAISLFLLVQWLISHNHDDSAASPVLPRPTASVEDKNIDWSKLYYVQHVTTPENLCSALTIWHSIQSIGSRAQRLMLYPSTWDIEAKDPTDNLTSTARMLQQAKKLYYVKLRPLDALNPNTTIWSSESNAALLGYNLTEFDRVIAIDGASVVKKNLDELFLVPAAPLAMPYIYWGGEVGWGFSGQLMVMTPSSSSFSSIEESLTRTKSTRDGESPLGVLETLFRGSILKLPQRPFALLTGEYRRTSHDEYLGIRSPRVWDVKAIFDEARILYFNDYPLPKPWRRAKQEVVNRYMPGCERSEWFGGSDCEGRTRWLEMYENYWEKRREVCGMTFDPEVEEVQSGRLGERRFYID